MDENIIESADITLRWSNGRITKIGSLDLESDTGHVRAKITRQRIGWEIVRLGMKLLLPGRWAHDTE